MTRRTAEPIPAERIVLDGAGVPLGIMAIDVLNASVDHYRNDLAAHEDWVARNALDVVLDELHERALADDPLETNRLAFDEEIAARNRRRSTPALRLAETFLGLKRRRQP